MAANNTYPTLIINRIYVICFILFLATPMAVMLTGMESEFTGRYDKLRESQKVKYKPIKWTKNGVVKYMRDVEGWFNDNFGFRNELVKMNSLAYRALNTSQDRNKYLVGKNGYLFKGDNTNNVVKVSTGREVFTLEGLQQYYEYLENIVNYFHSKGTPVYITIPPNKHTVYSDFLPGYLERKRPTMYEQLLEYKGNPLQIIDLFESLKAARMKYGDLLYYRTDSHWSMLGAYLGYRRITEAMTGDFPQITPLTLVNYKVNKTKVGGDLAYHANLMNWVDDYTIDVTLDQPLDSLIMTTPKGEVLMSGPGKTLDISQRYIVRNKSKPLTLLYIRDSFGTNLSFFVHQTFGTVVHYYVFNEGGLSLDAIMEKYQPDLVLLEFVERFLTEKPLDLERIKDHEAFNDSPVLLRLSGHEIVERSTKQKNCNIISTDSNKVSYESLTAKGVQFHFSGLNYPACATIAVQVKVFSPVRTSMKLYYSNEDKAYTQANSIKGPLQAGWNQVLFKFETSSFTGKIRLDIGYRKGNYSLESIEIRCLSPFDQ